MIFFIISFIFCFKSRFKLKLRDTLKVPGAPPQNISCMDTSSTTLKLSWLPPRQDRANGKILYYKIFFVEEGRSFEDSDSIKIWNVTDFVLDELRPFQKYLISILAGTRIGDGPSSPKGTLIKKFIHIRIK